jgi:hypothetical protein
MPEEVEYTLNVQVKFKYPSIFLPIPATDRDLNIPALMS